MTRMNRKLEYALMALKHMSAKIPGELTSAKEVVDVTGVPFDATARVMQTMANRGLLRSEHGAHGGYVIVRDLSKVSLFDLYEMILGKMEVARCLHGDGTCELEGHCNIQSPINFLHRRVTDFYRGLSLAELLRLKEREQGHEAREQ
jgi:Rrf2 family transcriptional regulator, nitric oxide-sensitive transcriptional repressor